jgi:hypothetical protein
MDIGAASGAGDYMCLAIEPSSSIFYQAEADMIIAMMLSVYLLSSSSDHQREIQGNKEN